MSSAGWASPVIGRVRSLAAEAELPTRGLLDEPDVRHRAGRVAVQGPGAPVELLHERAQLERDPQVAPEVDGEPEVLGHEVEREARVVVPVEHAVDVPLEEDAAGRAGDERASQ